MLLKKSQQIEVIQEKQRKSKYRSTESTQSGFDTDNQLSAFFFSNQELYADNCESTNQTNNNNILNII